MEEYILILFCMIFCHIIADYNLQGWLASAKQKEWWKENAPQELYKHDYIMALFMHSFSWSLMIMIPILVFIVLNDMNIGMLFIVACLINMGVHVIVDDLKANKRKINLIQDQIIHLLQILIIWGMWGILR